MNQIMFSIEVEQGKFLGGIDVIKDAYRALSETSSTYQLHTTRSGIKVLAFESFPDYIPRFHNREFDLVSSENHKVLHDSISTEVNCNFSINKAAVELFEDHFVQLSELQNQHINSPLVVTGRGMGGYLAILYAILHQHAVDVEESNVPKSAAKRPICITFGAPLLGDEALRRAIYERPQWTSCFLNVVAKMDTLASFFPSNTLYKPFGTFLFCTESGGHTAFDDQDTILTVLDDMASSNAGTSQMHDYTNDMGLIRRKILYRGASELGEFNLNPLRAGIVLQFQEIGLLKDNLQDLIAKTEDKRVRTIRKKRKDNAYEPTKKLNEMKISLTYMEWYMKGQKSKGGYYDSFKNAETEAKTKEEMKGLQEIIKHQRILNQYWERFVEDKNRKPQKDGAKLRTRWLLGGTNFRWIIEPLYIAEYYKNGNKNYIGQRKNHFKLLEKWLEEYEMEDHKPSDDKTKAASLTKDSCFWARVEEARILLRELTNGGSSSIATIEEFEEYVWKAINNLSVSPDVFLKGSSLMKWWGEYKAYKGSSYNSEFARFMNAEKYTSYPESLRR